MPVVRVRGGWLKIGRRRRPGEPDIGLPDEETPVDPDYGLEEGELPEVEPPEPPPGIWPEPQPGHPIVLPPGVSIPPGAVWPPIETSEKYVVAFVVAGRGVRKIHYTVIDGKADWPKPEHPIAPGGTPQPKR